MYHIRRQPLFSRASRLSPRKQSEMRGGWRVYILCVDIAITITATTTATITITIPITITATATATVAWVPSNLRTGTNIDPQLPSRIHTLLQFFFFLSFFSRLLV